MFAKAGRGFCAMVSLSDFQRLNLSATKTAVTVVPLNPGSNQKHFCIVWSHCWEHFELYMMFSNLLILMSNVSHTAAGVYHKANTFNSDVFQFTFRIYFNLILHIIIICMNVLV